jgi:biopolymer transport protein TolR
MEKIPNSRSAAKAHINVTPLVDVVLVLLIIFMIIIPFVQMGYKIDFPDKPREKEGPMHTPGLVLLRVAADSRIFINQEEVDRADLAARLSGIYQKRADKTIFFFADDRASYGGAVEILDVCRNNGVETVGLVAELQE